jgi:hypothetical protein
VPRVDEALATHADTALLDLPAGVATVRSGPGVAHDLEERPGRDAHLRTCVSGSAGAPPGENLGGDRRCVKASDETFGQALLARVRIGELGMRSNRWSGHDRFHINPRGRSVSDGRVRFNVGLGGDSATLPLSQACLDRGSLSDCVGVTRQALRRRKRDDRRAQ